MSILQYASPNYNYSAEDRATLEKTEGWTSQAQYDAAVKEIEDRTKARGDSQAVAFQAMNNPSATNLSGMSGFSSAAKGTTAMGYGGGGIVQNYAEGGPALQSPFADPIRKAEEQALLGQSQPAQQSQMTTQAIGEEDSGLPQPEVYQPMVASQNLGFLSEMQNSLPPPTSATTRAIGEDGQGPQMGGIGGVFADIQRQQGPGQMEQAASLFDRQPQMQGVGGQFQEMHRGFGQQMAGMQGAPLENYKSYLQQVYNAPEMQSATQALGEALSGRVDEFVGMVDEAERAHFGAEESFGFGGGDFQKGLMSQFEGPMQGQMGGGGPQINIQQMPAAQQKGLMGGIGGTMGQQQGQMGMFAEGGMVAARPPVSGPNPQATFPLK